MTTKDYQERSAQIPHEPGVYRFFDENGTVIYVGKAKNLKKRLSSYFGEKKHQQFKTKALVRNAVNFEYTIVETEHDALLLENTLIKKFQPRYNVMLKDGKTYVYIVVKKERFPRVFFTRRVFKDGSHYFGPYTSKYRANIILDVIKKLFKLRTCNLKLSEKNIEAGKFKVCLEYHIKNCMGPCVGYESEEDYNEKIRQVKNILKGQISPVRDWLKQKIAQCAEALDFEEAQYYKERLDTLTEYQSKSTVVNTTIKDSDVFSLKVVDDMAYVSYLKIINGALVNSDNLELKMNLNDNEDDLLSFSINYLREKFNSISAEVILDHKIDLIDEVQVTVPQRGDKKHLLDLAEKNLKYYILQKKKESINRIGKQTPAERIMKTLKEDLQMDVMPFHIECFDNSNIQGSDPVASCVVFKNAKPSKKDYRKFNIKTVVGPDDFASMKEVVSRRYKRLKEENQPLPQLIIIDGGKGQLSAAYEIIKDLGLEKKITLVGIAKRLEEIYFPEDPIPLYINKKSESLKLIQQLRNEAHRFAITFHRDQRSKNALGTELTNIPGIGDKISKDLLRHYGSVKRIKEATQDDITAHFSQRIAEKLKTYFNDKKEG
ncbi:MAG: excinuclease ABC subunit C [Saprospiraceae bacterium]|nr:excinuclease ABC subunit C [Saprospiraceae bacterium]